MLVNYNHVYKTSIHKQKITYIIIIHPNIKLKNVPIFFSSELDPTLPILIPNDMLDWMAHAYQSFNKHVVNFRKDMTSIEGHFQAIKSIHFGIVETTRKKGLIGSGLHKQKNYEAVYQSMEENIKKMNNHLDKITKENPNRILTRTRDLELLADKKEKYKEPARLNVDIKENKIIVKSTKQKTNQFKTPLLKVSEQRKLEKPKYMESTNSPHNPPPKTPPTTQKNIH